MDALDSSLRGSASLGAKTSRAELGSTQWCPSSGCATSGSLIARTRFATCFEGVLVEHRPASVGPAFSPPQQSHLNGVPQCACGEAAANTEQEVFAPRERSKRMPERPLEG